MKLFHSTNGEWFRIKYIWENNYAYYTAFLNTNIYTHKKKILLFVRKTNAFFSLSLFVFFRRNIIWP